MEWIRGEYDHRKLLLGLHLHGIPRWPTRGNNRYQTSFRLQHVGVKLRHSTDTAGGYLRLHRSRHIESRTGIYAGTSLFHLGTIKIIISVCVCLVRNDLINSESIEHLSLHVIQLHSIEWLQTITIIIDLSKLIRLANQGATWPAIQPMTARWIPPMERSKFVSHMMGKWSWSNSLHDREIQANRCHNHPPASFLSLKKLRNVYARKTQLFYGLSWRRYTIASIATP